MKKVLYKEIDGFKIIIGFSDCIVDPVATQKIASKAFEKTEEFKQLKMLAKEQNGYYKMMAQAQQSYKQADKNKNRADMEKYKIDYYSRQNDINKVQEQIIKIKPLLDEKKKSLLQKNQVFFEPTLNEIHVRDDVADTLKLAFVKNEFVDIDGNVVKNNKGVYYEFKNDEPVKHEINELNLSADSNWIKESMLTDKQKEIISDYNENLRISKLTDEEKKKEAGHLKDIALLRSNEMRSKLEIQGDNKALKKSQDYYNEQCDLIDERYSV